MKKYIQCILRADPLIIMNVEKAKNIEYINKKLWNIKEKYVKELPHLHVFGDAKVCGNAQVYDYAVVFENVYVFGDAQVYGNARVYGSGRVYGNAKVCGNAYVFGDAVVFENAYVFGNARVYRHAQVCGNSRVSGNAQVYGSGRVYGNARVYGKAKVYRHAQVDAYSELFGEAKATTKTYNIGFLQWNVTLSDKHIQIGCKQWEYEKFLRLSEIHIGLEYSQEEYSEMENAKNIIIETIKLKRPDLFKKEDE